MKAKIDAPRKKCYTRHAARGKAPAFGYGVMRPGRLRTRSLTEGEDNEGAHLILQYRRRT